MLHHSEFSLFTVLALVCIAISGCRNFTLNGSPSAPGTILDRAVHSGNGSVWTHDRGEEPPDQSRGSRVPKPGDWQHPQNDTLYSQDKPPF
jgi:hypothetical protein